MQIVKRKKDAHLSHMFAEAINTHFCCVPLRLYYIPFAASKIHIAVVGVARFKRILDRKQINNNNECDLCVCVYVWYADECEMTYF